jgi:hypothetical protein
MLDMEGARSMTNIRSFCLDHSWPDWTPVHDIIQSNVGEGEYQKVAVLNRQKIACMIYFPDNSSADLALANHFAEAGEVIVQWYNPASDSYSDESEIDIMDGKLKVSPPPKWPDAILILKAK